MSKERTCEICWAWQPTKWNGWKWIDEEAPCSIREGERTNKGSKCEHCSIIKPKDFVKRSVQANSLIPAGTTIRDAGADSLVSAMEAWYKANEAQFDDVGHLRDQKEEDEMYPHQTEDIERFKDETEIALFLEQGMGKSAIALRIAAHKYLKGEIDSLLVIAPNGLHLQWATEQIPKWLPAEIQREVQCFGGRGGAKDTYPFRYKDALHIVTVNIDTFSLPTKWQDIAQWVKASKCMIILDEATSVKNVKAKRTERVLYEFNDVVRRRSSIISSTVRTVARAILTGTPATNGITDLWTLMEFLRPNYFGRNWYSFRNRYAMLASITTAYGSTQIMLTADLWDAVKGCDTYEKAYMLFGVSSDTYETIQMQTAYQGAYKHEEELRELIKPVSVFRTIKECVDMPPQVYNKKTIQMSIEQLSAYKSMESELLAMYAGATATAANKLSALVRLQQISSGFLVQGQLKEYDPNDESSWWGGESERDIEPGEVVWLGSKLPKLEALYRDVDESSKPCIIITRFSAEAARIYDDLSKVYKCLLYTGWKKTGSIEEFKEGKYEILVANIRVISRGFNLQNSCQMFFYSNTFSLEDRLQAEGRVFRIGQTNTCVYTDYICEDTIDLKVVGALRQKRALLDYIRGTSLTAFVSEEDDVSTIEGVA